MKEETVINIYRIKIDGQTKILKNPIITINGIGTGDYRKIILKTLHKNPNIFTLKEYNKKIVEFCNFHKIVVEDEDEYIPTFFEKEMDIIFRKKGALNIGMIFDCADLRLVEKTITKVCKYARFLTIPKYIRCDRIVEKILDTNGLNINVENSIEKIRKKCDIIIDINKNIIETEEY